MSFKDKLKEKRLEANLTQVQLAEKVSVTPRTIQHYELGTRKPTKLDIVEKLAKALNTTPEYLLGQNGLLVEALNDAYWIAKEKNKKYTPKKYRKGTSKQ